MASRTDQQTSKSHTWGYSGDPHRTRTISDVMKLIISWILYQVGRPFSVIFEFTNWHWSYDAYCWFMHNSHELDVNGVFWKPT